jgi:hypothetical protein
VVQFVFADNGVLTRHASPDRLFDLTIASIDYVQQRHSDEVLRRCPTDFAYRLRTLTGRGDVHAGKPVDIGDQNRRVRM